MPSKILGPNERKPTKEEDNYFLVKGIMLEITFCFPYEKHILSGQ